MSITYKITPGSTINGHINIPGDKSISHRSIMFAALAEGKTTITGLLEGEDVLATLNAFREMGVNIDKKDAGILEITGSGLYGLHAPKQSLYLGNAGTAMRLMAGLMAAQSFNTHLIGDDSLTQRPMDRVIKPLTEMGAVISGRDKQYPPLNIAGNQQLSGIQYTLPVPSAQVKSCLLLAGVYAKGETTITEPETTRDHTEKMLQAFGYPVTVAPNKISLTGGGKLTATNIKVPADISSAAFFIVAAILNPGADLLIKSVGINATRIGVIHILKLMGADIQCLNNKTWGKEPVADIRVKYSKLHGITIPKRFISLAIDEFPILFIAAACAQGVTRLTGAGELRIKESDRIQAMAEGLMTLGIQVKTMQDGIEITGGTMSGGCVESFHDHRIAMAFTIAGLRASSVITVMNCDNVATSFPDFVSIAQQAGINIEQY